jgi:hypothetical protein
MLHRHDYALGAGDEIHGAAHAGHHLLRDHPVGQETVLVNLQPAEHGEIEVTAANEAERHGTVERAGAGQGGDGPAGRVRERGMRHALLGWSAGPDQPVLGLEEHVQPLREIVCYQRRNADPEIDQHARLELSGDAPCNDDLRFHWGAHALATR